MVTIILILTSYILSNDVLKYFIFSGEFQTFCPCKIFYETFLNTQHMTIDLRPETFNDSLSETIIYTYIDGCFLEGGV